MDIRKDRPTLRIAVAFALGAVVFLSLDAIWLTTMADRLPGLLHSVGGCTHRIYGTCLGAVARRRGGHRSALRHAGGVPHASRLMRRSSSEI